MSVQKKVVSIVLNDFTHDSRVLKECGSLIGAGYQVRVAAMHTIGLAEKENKDGLEVRRYQISAQKLSKGLFFSGIKYLQLLWKIYRDNRDADIYHCNDIEALPIGVIAKWMGKGKKVVYDAHEFESEKAGIGGVHKKLLLLFERFFIRYADRTITVGEQIAKEYQNIFNIEKPALVMNCPVLHEGVETEPLLRREFSINADKTILLSQGALSYDRGIKEMLEAFSNLDRTDLVLIFMGYGDMVDLIKSYSIKHLNIYYLPSVPPEKVLSYTASADVGLIFTQNICLNNYYSLPNKFFEYIHSGLGIIAWPLFEVEKIINKYDIGIITKDFSTASIESSLEMLNKKDIDRYKKNVTDLKYKYNWQQQEAVLLGVYNNLFL